MDMTETVNFISALFADKPAEQFIHVWSKARTDSNGTSAFFPDVESAADFCERTQTCDVWVGAGTRPADLGPYKRGEADTITGIPGIWLDADYADAGHKKTNLPPDEAQALALIAALGVEPTLIVHSGHGLQPWWLFDSFWSFRNDTDREAAARLTQAVNARFKALSESVGYSADNVSDLARIMRAVGTINHKAEPVPVTILRNGGPRYTRKQLREAFPDVLPVPVATPYRAEPTGNLSDPGYWLQKALGWASDGTRHDHGVKLACQLRDNCVASAGVSRCESILDAWRVAVDDNPADRYTDSEIRSLKNILTDGRDREPSGSKRTPDYRSTYEPTPMPEDDDAPEEAAVELPKVVCSNRQLRDMTTDAVAALNAGNEPKRLFVRAGSLSRLRITDNVGAIEPLGIDTIRCRMSQTADYVRYGAKGNELSIPPPTDVAKDVLALGEWPFPLLDTIVATPVIRQDGSLLTQSGYDEATRLYYHPEPLLNNLSIPDKPTPAEVESAVAVIFDILQDFPWVKTYDYANTLGMMLTPICRSAIKGGAPLAIIDATQPGAGKGLLTRIINLIATGQEPALMTAPDNREEWRKTITTQLMQGRSLIVIDNIEHKLFDAALASVLTMERWTDRLLGTNTSVEVPNHACWIATGNNIKLGGDIPRRCYWIKIDPQTSRPELRSGFKHSNLPDYVRRNRDKIVAALLTMVRAWYVAGQPMPSTPILGSFEEWSRIIGGVIEYCGVYGFLGNTDELRKLASEDDEEWELFLDAIFNRWGENEFTTQDIDKLMGADAIFQNAAPTFLVEIRTNPKLSFTRQLGKQLSKLSGKCFGEDDVHIEKTSNIQYNKVHWCIKSGREWVPVETQTDPESNETGGLS
jgi:hypothetical protein